MGLATLPTDHGGYRVLVYNIRTNVRKTVKIMYASRIKLRICNIVIFLSKLYTLNIMYVWASLQCLQEQVLPSTDDQFP